MTTSQIEKALNRVYLQKRFHNVYELDKDCETQDIYVHKVYMGSNKTADKSVARFILKRAKDTEFVILGGVHYSRKSVGIA